MNILVVGAGAIGCLVGGRLAATGHSVTLLGRAKLVSAVNETGLKLIWPDGAEQVVHPAAVENLADLNLAEYDLILVTVKSFDTVAAVEPLKGRLSPATRILSLQNGVGNEQALAETLPGQPVVAGSITLPVEVPAPGTFKVSKDKGGIGLAPVKAETKTDDIVQALQGAGFTVAVYDDYRSLKWSKLLMNIISNASAAILDMPPDKALAYPAIFDLELDAMRETIAVMEAQGIKVVALPSYPLPTLALALKLLPNFVLRKALRGILVGGRGDKLPSLLLDLKQGRNQSEVTVLNYAVAQAGAAAGVNTPVNQMLSEILLNVVKGKVAWTTYQGQPEKLRDKR